MFGKSASWWFGGNSVFGKSKKVFTKEKQKDASDWLGGFIEDVNPTVETSIAPQTIGLIAVGILVLSRFV